MKIAVRYYTRTGNTRRLAEAVAEAPARAAAISSAGVKGARRFPARTSAEELKAWAAQYLD